jgi:hypothetical protein
MGKNAKWAVELMGEGITYAPRKAIKSQVLADFVAEWTETQTPPAPVDTRVLDVVFRWATDEERSWDGTRLCLPPPDVRMRYMIRIHFSASNNVTEYEALVNGLHIATELRI